MKKLQILKSALVCGASVVALVSPSAAKVFNVPEGDLAAALDTYIRQSGVQLIYMDNVSGHKSRGAKGDLTETAALTQILRGTGFTARTLTSSTIDIVPQQSKPAKQIAQITPKAAAPAAQSGVETVVVTAQHKSENIQQVPIAVTALSQQQLTERQIAGGPDLLRDVPNMNFSKTNFSGYNIEMRGIGTQAISVTTDPAVAVAFNDIPFIRNHFFEQEFYDLSDAEVLRGPQGTLYGRNATAGVVNIKSALPTDSYEAMVSFDKGNYDSYRYEGMLNIPLVGDKLDLRVAGEWTKREGYTEDTTLDTRVDGRDLWSGRMTLGWNPTSDFHSDLIWEHFSEDDDRLRSGKQLCETAPDPTTVDGVPVNGHYFGATVYDPNYYLSQGCEPTSLYSSSAFEVPNGKALSYASALGILYVPIQQEFDPYASTTQSTNLRQIESTILPHYRAKNDTLEYNANWSINSDLTFTSQTGFNKDFLFSTEDYNRFDTAPGAFIGQDTTDPWQKNTMYPDPSDPGAYAFCDPQLGCSDRIVAEDLSDERAWQFSQEFRLASNYSGPINFSAGGNYLHYETVENYYVFINTLTMATADGLGGFASEPQSTNWVPGVSNNSQCLPSGYAYVNPAVGNNPLGDGCSYIDPNPIGSLNNEGHNYFLSQNPYVLNSYALFGEMYYNIAPDLKFTAGARWTEDQKHFLDIPSELLEPGYGYPVTTVVNQRWDAPTGRAVLDWTPDFDFTDQTLVYGSYSHGYKAGGANPPGAELLTALQGDTGSPIHPLTFKPEFIDAFELGTKNTLLDNSLTVDADIFYYAYTGYQISEIVDRTAINDNYNASVKGGELEANWEPTPGLKFGFTGGYENATANNGDAGIDLMDRTAGVPGWIVVRPFITQASNCILPTYVVAAALYNVGYTVSQLCSLAYGSHVDPVTDLPYMQSPSAVGPSGMLPPFPYPGFDPLSVDPNAPKGVNNGLGLPPNNGEGFAKNLGDNQLPNAPHFTTSLTAEYSMPVFGDWAATLHADLYWQSQSWARIFNDNPYDKIHGYSNVNLSLILNSSNGWQVMAYVKNVFDTTAITGDFLNSDDTGLTTNVFLTDPRLFGVRVTKQLDQSDGFWGSDYTGYDFFTSLFSDTDNGKPPLWIQLGGNFDRLADDHQVFDPPFAANIPSNYGSVLSPQRSAQTGMDWEARISFEPDGSDWVFSASARYGRASRNKIVHHQTNLTKTLYLSSSNPNVPVRYQPRYVDERIGNSESHAILDFMAGKNVGLGSLNLPGTSMLSGGLRYAAFTSESGVDINTVPDSAQNATGPKYHHHSFSGFFDAQRSFHGLGPSISWENSTPFSGEEQNGKLAVDWGANAAVLFGRQRASGYHKTGGAYYCGNHNGVFFGRNAHCPVKTAFATGSRYISRIPQISHYQRTKAFNRSRMVAVPNLGGFVGLSMKYNNAKVSFGYRADEFFGAIDGGIDTYKSENRGFFGPYANISIGIGG